MILKPLTVPGNLEFLDAIALFVVEAAKLACLDRQTTYKLRLAVDEIATNIIQHGYTEANLKGEITCYAELNKACLTIIVEDWGIAYDYLKYTDLDSLQKPLTERPIGGLGIYLAIQSVDDFQYQRLDNRNRHLLSIKRSERPRLGKTGLPPTS